MFSALKKLTTRSSSGETGNSHNGTGVPPPGLTTMSSSLQKKFSRGVNFNMKIILKGDRNVGKTQVFKRLQGLSFAEEYTSTEEIQVANITWNYKTSDDIVKVEIWDVVDVANKKKRITDKLKIENCQEGSIEGENDMANEIALDANTIDVYKNTNGVLLVFDITKNWTFDYVKREILNVPEHIPILLLGNRCDMGHHRAVAGDTVIFFIESLERNPESAEIRYAESSMRNGFGLKFIHKFFNLPFLHLQKETLLKQLETNRDETDITVQELDLYCEGDDANYDLFIEGLSQKRRLVADALSPPKLSLAEAQALASERALKESKTGVNAISMQAAAAKVTIKSDPTSNAAQSLPPSLANKIPGASSVQQLKGSDTAVKGVVTDIIPQQKPVHKGGVATSPTKIQSASSGDSKAGRNSAKVVVDDFVPDEDDPITSFFDDNQTTNQYTSNQKYGNHFGETSEDEGEMGNGGNPLVLAHEEDIEVDKIVISSPQQSQLQSQLSSSEDEVQIKPSQSESIKETDEKLGFSMFLQNNTVSNDKDETTSQEEKRSSKKSHHKKSKHKRSHKSKDKDRHQRDLEDFLSGDYVAKQEDLDTSAYEAI